MLNILSLKKKGFGLDISDLSIKIASLKKKGGFLELTSFGEFPVGPGIIEQGEIKREEELIKIIKESLLRIKGQSIETKNVGVSLPEEKSFLEVIRMPFMEKEEIAEAVGYEAENYIPLPLEQVYLDFWPIPLLSSQKQPDYLDVLVVAIPKATVDPYIRVLKGAGLGPIFLETESEAIARALIKDGTTKNWILILDMGATRTGFSVFAGSSLRFICSIPVCGRIFDRMIAKEMKISLTEAEKRKIKQGLGRKNGAKMFEILIPCLTDLVEQVRNYLNYCYKHVLPKRPSLNGKSVEKILLCGGGANLKGINDFLVEHLAIPVEKANPWTNILTASGKDQPKLSLKDSLRYSTAIGLALRAAGIKIN